MDVDSGIVDRLSDRIDGSLPILLGTLVTLSLSVYGLATWKRILFYPSLILFISVSSGYILYRTPTDNLSFPLDIVDVRVLDIAILFLVATSCVLSRSQPIGLPDVYYWSLLPIPILIVIRILHSVSIIALFQTLLFGLTMRSALWYSAPVVGQDAAKLHVGIVSYIAETGTLIPTSVIYYHWYPAAHVFSSTLSLLTELPLKVSMFWSIIVPLVLLLPLFYIVVLDLFEERGIEARVAGMVSILLIVVNGRNITGNPHPQTLGWALLIPLLYLTLERKDRKITLLYTGLVSVLTVTHNLTPVILLVILLSLFVADRVRGVLDWRDPLEKKINYSIAFVLVVGIALVQYYQIASYFALQVRRVIGIFLLRGGLQQDISGSVIASGGGFGLLDPLLHQGMDLLLYLFAVSFVFVIKYLSYIRGVRDPFSNIWYFVVVLLTGFVGGSMVLGGSSNTARALGVLSILVAPVVGHAIARLSTRKLGLVLALGVVIAFPLTTAVASEYGIRNPGMSPTERTGDVRIHLTDEEVASVNFITERDFITNSDGYLSSYAGQRSLHDGWGGPIKSVGSIRELNRENITENSPFVYRRSMQEIAGVTYPPTCSVFYDSGDAQLIRCRHSE